MQTSLVLPMKRQMAQAGTRRVRWAVRRRKNVRDGMTEKGARWSVQDRWCEMVPEECSSLQVGAETLRAARA
jgi:hypothetical protein